jgi:predicted component of type VI protein secretion system
MKTIELSKIINDTINEQKNKYQFINIMVNNIDKDILDVILKTIIKTKNVMELDELKRYVDTYIDKNKEKEILKIDEEIAKLEELKKKLQ